MLATVLAFGLSQAAFAVEVLELRPIPRPGAEIVARVEATPETEPVVIASSSREPFEGTLVATSEPPRARPLDLLDDYQFRFALALTRQGNWEAAKQAALRDSAVAAAVIEWKRLRAGRGAFSDYQTFLVNHADWPGLKLLRKRGERSITDEAFADDVIAYFKEQPPQTGYGALRLVDALAAKGDFNASRSALILAWRQMDMKADEEALFLEKHAEALKPFHVARMDDALWREDRETARRMLALVEDEDAKLIANARLALQARTGSADSLWKAVPEALADHPGLAKDRMRWLVAVKRRSEAGDLIISQSTTRARLGRPEAWSEWRAILARQSMRDGAPRRAYAMASSHFLDGGSDYADLEWLSGYLALRFQDDPSQALTHFRHFRSEVYTPISLGRAGYWQGRALEKLGEADAAMTAFQEAANHQTSFYGLLAAEHINAPMDPGLTGAGGPVPWQETAFAKTDVFKAADLFFQANENYEVTRFLRHLSEITAKEELVALGDYAVSLGNPFIAVRVGKRIARDGVVAPRAYYPLTDLGQATLPVEKALALAISRRESEFFAGAVSHAGARGLMQLMPATAQDMARKLDLPYSRGKLTGDPVYNVQLGSAYLDHLIDEFGNNIALISVGYNAGPHRARRWSETYGDPRDPAIDIVDWIEHIPFNETRNYVMRVAESLPVYRARLTGQTARIEITEELKSR